jgi:hypothetical protein
VDGAARRRTSKESLATLEQAAHAFAVRASQLGYGTKESLAAVGKALTEVKPARHSA